MIRYEQRTGVPKRMSVATGGENNSYCGRFPIPLSLRPFTFDEFFISH